MKKSILLTALAFVALGCSKTEVKPVEDAPAQISWNAVVGKASTKAPVEGTAFDKAHKFITYAFFNAAGTTWPTDASLYIDNQVISYYKDAEEPFVADSWHSGTVNYWPKQGSLTFFSYSLGDDNHGCSAIVTCTKDDGLKISGFDVNVSSDKNRDLMVADVQTGQKQNTTDQAGAAKGVPTIFRHALTWITGFQVRTAADYYNVGTPSPQIGSKEITVNSIKICNVYSKGDYQLLYDKNKTNNRDESWNNQTESHEYAFRVASGASNVASDVTPVALACDQLLFMPQTFTAPNFTYSDGATPIQKAIERQTTAYKEAVKNVGHIELEYTIKTYTSSSDYSEETVKEYIALADFTSSIDGSTNGGDWKINRKITYNITIDLSANIIYWDPIVVEWEEENKTISL